MKNNKWATFSNLSKFVHVMILYFSSAYAGLAQPKPREVIATPDPLDKDTVIVNTGDKSVFCQDTNYTNIYFANSFYPLNSLYRVAVTSEFSSSCDTVSVPENFYLPIVDISERIASGILCGGSQPELPINKTSDSWQYVWSNTTLNDNNISCEAVILYCGRNLTCDPDWIQCVIENIYSVTKQFEESEQNCQTKDKINTNLLWILVIGFFFCWVGGKFRSNPVEDPGYARLPSEASRSEKKKKQNQEQNQEQEQKEGRANVGTGNIQSETGQPAPIELSSLPLAESPELR